MRASGAHPYLTKPDTTTNQRRDLSICSQGEALPKVKHKPTPAPACPAHAGAPGPSSCWRAAPTAAGVRRGAGGGSGRNNQAAPCKEDSASRAAHLRRAGASEQPSRAKPSPALPHPNGAGAAEVGTADPAPAASAPPPYEVTKCRAPSHGRSGRGRGRGQGSNLGRRSGPSRRPPPAPRAVAAPALPCSARSPGPGGRSTGQGRGVRQIGRASCRERV